MMSADQPRAETAGMVSMCSLRAGSGLFGIDTGQIREVLGAIVPQPVPLAPEYIAGIVPYRGDVLTTVSLRTLLGLERIAKSSCMLVLDEEGAADRFGLIVDCVEGVTMMTRDSLTPNPTTLDARCVAVFDGAYSLESGLMVRLNPQRLRPSRLAQSSLFGVAGPRCKGEHVCER
jgi:purine-binding chemotaxis protein CheW